MAMERYTMAGERPVEVLLAGSDPDYLQQVASRVTADGIQAHTVATTDPEAAIARLNEDSVDCLIATYNPSANEGLPILEYLRDDSVEVPVILLPSGPTTVVVSENLVVDVASVFTRDEAVNGDGSAGGGLDADVVVDAVEKRQASKAAQRRRGLERATESVARDLAEADEREAVDRTLVEGMTDTDEIDGAWLADVDGEEVDVREAADEGTDAPPPTDGPPSKAARRALAAEQPQVTHHDGTNYAAVPVTPENDESRVLAMASGSRYAFSDEETRVLRDVGDTATRAIDDVARRRIAPADVDGREAFETVVERLSVPVVAYGDAGWIAGANESFADLVGESRETVVGQPVWEVLPSPRLETFEDYWASFSAGETRTQLVEFDDETFRQLVTTRVAVGEEEYNVSLAVDRVDESADSWFADVLAYEFRHWLAIAEEALEGEDEEEEAEVVDAVVDRMQDAISSEVQAARAGGRSETGDLVLDEPAGASAGEADAGEADAGDAVEAAGEPVEVDGTEAEPADVERIEAAEAEPTGADAEAGPARAEADGLAAGSEVDGAVEPGEPESLELDEAELADAASTSREESAPEAEFSVEPQPISGLARDAWMTVVGEFGEYEIRGKRKVRADETLLHRLFAHLFRTLFSYGKASGVDVGVGEDGFFVEDDGSGVPHARREYVSGETMTDAKSGAGIQVARRLARRHGWSLKIEATEDGGTRFVVSGAEVIED